MLYWLDVVRRRELTPEPDDGSHDRINKFSHNSIKKRFALVWVSEEQCNYKVIVENVSHAPKFVS